MVTRVPLPPTQAAGVEALRLAVHVAQAKLEAVVTVLAAGHVPEGARLIAVESDALVFDTEDTDAH